jgi:hypothetical protein
VSLSVVSQNARVAIAAWDDILVSIWRADVEVADIKPAELGQDELMRKYRRYGSLAIAEKGALRMSGDARKEAARITELGKSLCAGVAVVIGVDGFTGAAIRAAIAGVHILSRSKMPTRSFDKVPAAARWMYEQLQRDPADLDAFVAAVEHLRAGS